MNAPSISVLVPVYNTAQWLRRCIDSILTQTYTDFELLLIDDGSTDNSGAICDEYVSADPRVRVFHKPNGGVSSARNLGLDNAKGEWVIFIDSDDYWGNQDSLRLLMNQASKTKAEIIRGEYIAVDEYENIVFERNYPLKQNLDKILTLDEFLYKAIGGEFFLVLCLVKKNIIGTKRYSEQQIFLEDMRFFIELLSVATLFAYIPLRFYCYQKLSSSKSTQLNFQQVADSFGMCDFFWNIGQYSQNETYRTFCYEYSVMMYRWSLQTISSNTYYGQRKNIIKSLNLTGLQARTYQRCKLGKLKSDWKSRLIFWVNPSIGILIFKLSELLNSFLRWVRNIQR